MVVSNQNGRLPIQFQAKILETIFMRLAMFGKTDGGEKIII